MTLVRLAWKFRALRTLLFVAVLSVTAQSQNVRFEPNGYAGNYHIRNVTTNAVVGTFSGVTSIPLANGTYNVDFGPNLGADTGFQFTVSPSVSVSNTTAAYADNTASPPVIGFHTATVQILRNGYNGRLIFSSGLDDTGTADFAVIQIKGLRFRIDHNSGSYPMVVQLDGSGNAASVGALGSLTTSGNQVTLNTTNLPIRPQLFSGQYYVGSHTHLVFSGDKDIVVIRGIPTKISIGGLGHAGMDFTVPVDANGNPQSTGSSAYAVVGGDVNFNTAAVNIQTTWPNLYHIGGYHNLSGTQTRDMVPVTALIQAGSGAGTVSVFPTAVSPNPKTVDVAGTPYLFSFSVPGPTPPAVGNIGTFKSNAGSPHRMDSDATGIYYADQQSRQAYRLQGEFRQSIAGSNQTDPVLCDQPLPAACSDSKNVYLGFPIDVAVGPNGTLFVADIGTHRVIRLIPSATSSTGYSAETYVGQSWQYNDDNLAVKHRLSASLSQPQGIDFSGGKLWIADTWNDRVIEVDPDTNLFRTVAGRRFHGFDGDGAPAWQRALRFPTDVESKGDHLWIVDSYNNRLRRVNLVSGDYELETVAGSDFWYSGDCGPASDATFRQFSSLAFDGSGNLYLTDLRNHALRRINAGANQLIDSTDIIETVAGGIFPGYNGDNIAANTAYLNYPIGVTVHAGLVYVSDAGNGRIRWINPGASTCQAADTTPPTIVATGVPNGWTHGAHVVLDANDGEGSGVATIHFEMSGVEAGSDDVEASQVTVPINNEGITTLLYYATDVAGNQSEPASVVVQVDRTSPSIQCDAVPSAWSNSDVTVACFASDHLSGVAGNPEFLLTTTVPDDVETDNAVTDSHNVCDLAGNCEPYGPLTGVMVDKKDPTINIVSPSAGTYVAGQTITAQYTCSDGGSGVATCSGPSASGGNIAASVGTHTFTVNAVDGVGNSATQSRTYSVGYGICKLYDSSKSHRRGSAIPLKIQLCDSAGTNLSSAGVTVTAVQLIHVSSNASGVVEDTGNANPDHNFRYDATLGGSGGYIFNLDTNALQPGTWIMRVEVSGDPTVHATEVMFQVRQ